MCTCYRFDCSAIVQWRYRIYKYITDSNFSIYVLVKWSSSSHTLVCIFFMKNRGSLWLYCNRCMYGPAGLISVNASIWVHTKNGKRSLTTCGWRSSLCASALIQMMHMHSVFSLNEWFLSNHTLYMCLFICKKQKSRHISSHFLIRFLSFRFFLSSCFLPVCLCLSVVRLSVETWFCHQLLWAFVFWGLWQPHGQTLWVFIYVAV